jgi:proline iminopeptidase
MRSITLFIFLSAFSLANGQDFEGHKKLNGTDLYLSIRGNGENLVVIHGGPGLNHHYFRPHFHGLEKKFRVVYYDQRASGKSAIPSPDSISFKFFADDLEAIRKELKAEKLNILAHSWGAIPAIHYALAYPDRVDKLILSNTALLSREYDGETAALVKQHTSKEDSTQRANIMAKGSLTPVTYDRIMHLSFRASSFNKLSLSKLNLNIPSNFMQANKALFTGLMKDPAAQANLYDSLTTFRFPVMIIHGAYDLVPDAALKRLRDSLPKAEFVMFKESGHFPFVEEKEKYITVVSSFLKKKN